MTNIVYKREWLKEYSTPEFESKYTCESKLGSLWSKEKTIFRIWSPYAQKIYVKLYNTGDIEDSNVVTEVEMKYVNKGMWESEIVGNLSGKYYTFSVAFDDEVNECCDPYAITTGVNGKRAMVLDLESTNPEGWENDSNPNEMLPINQYIIYELHTRDFSIDKYSGMKNKGKFLAFTENNTHIPDKLDIHTGVDYLKNLGITHIHFLPIYDYATIDEKKPYSEDEYNWGYDPLNYNTLEGSYSTDPRHGEVRIKEFKEAVKNLHNNGISVIMDVVYNHTFSEDFCYNKAVPGYFYRISEDGTLSDGSSCGNDTASERSMVEKYIIDSVKFYAKEYHIDGFRFDLVGLITVDTIKKIREELNKIRPGIIMYGEGWTLNTKLTKENIKLATQNNINELDGFAMFSDNIRDAIKGSVFEESEKGFVSGNIEFLEEIKKSVMGLPDWSRNANDVVNYTSCHDNYTLFDKLILCNPEISKEDRISQNKLAISIVMMSQGIPLLHAGEEILREKKRKDGTLVSDSVRDGDYVNSIKWENLLDQTHREVYEYYKGLIEFRKEHKALHLVKKEEIVEAISFLDTDSDLLLAYLIDTEEDKLLVFFNADDKNHIFDIKNSKYFADDAKLECFIDECKAGYKVLYCENENIEIKPYSCKVIGIK